jgi:hypothetical protein
MWVLWHLSKSTKALQRYFVSFTQSAFGPYHPRASAYYELLHPGKCLVHTASFQVKTMNC